jgi:Uma2 family endonuclease
MLAEIAIGRDALARRWAELGEDADTPDYYELNEFGELIMTPRPTNDHQRVVQAVANAIAHQLGPESVAEVSLMTDRGIRVPDVVWMPPAKWQQVKGKTPLPFAPDLCVEILSAGNTREEIAMKAGAYLRGGAREVVVVGLQGQIEYLGPEGARLESVFGLSLCLDRTLF